MAFQEATHSSSRRGAVDDAGLGPCLYDPRQTEAAEASGVQETKRNKAFEQQRAQESSKGDRKIQVKGKGKSRHIQHECYRRSR